MQTSYFPQLRAIANEAWIIASGKAEEKKERLSREKAERRKAKEKELLERRVNRVYTQMWVYNQTYSYSVVTPEGTTAVESVWCKLAVNMI
jgi:tubulin--tyrosine ligase-like protein 12